MKKGSSKPLRTSKGELIRSIDQRILEYELMKEEISNEIQRYLSACQQNNVSLSGIDYTQDKIMGGALQTDFQTALRKIDGLQLNLNRVLDQISELKKKRKKLVDMYRQDQTIDAKVFFYREVMGYSQEMTAMKIGYSTRQIQRIERRMKEKNSVRF